jgi:hypothetical protein
MSGGCGPREAVNWCTINHSGWCSLETASYEEMDRLAHRCGFIRVNDRYLLWKYGVTFKDLNCGNCGYYEAGELSYGVCANELVKPHSKGIIQNGEKAYIDSKEYYGGAHACGKFIKRGSGGLMKESCIFCAHITDGYCDIHDCRPIHIDDSHGCTYFQLKGRVCDKRCGNCTVFSFNTPAMSWGRCTEKHVKKEIHKKSFACIFYSEEGQKVPKQTYWTKCGRMFEKNSTAVVTGFEVNENDQQCVACPFRIEVTEGWGENKKHIRWECRAGSREPNHTTEWTGSLEDKNTLNIHSLDHQLMEEILLFCKNHPDLGAGYNADHMADCRRTISVSCSSNKKGIAAKKELIEKYFPARKAKSKVHHCGDCNYGHWFSGENTYTSVVSDDGIRTIKRPCDTHTHYCYQVSEDGQKKIAADKDFDPNTSPDWCPMEKTILANQPEVKDDQYEGGVELFFEQKCRVCGCKDNNACEGGCYWVEPDLCSKCAENFCDETNCPFNNGQGSCCFAEEDSECEGFQQIVIKAVDEYGCKNPDVCLTHKIIVDPDSCDVQGEGSNLCGPENESSVNDTKTLENVNETPENDTKALENVNETAISANDTTKPEIFDYSTVDDETAQYLREKAFRIAEISGKAKTLIGKELKDAQDELSKRGYGCFEEWYTAGGYSKTQVYRLINRYDFVCSNLEQASELEQLPDSLMYEISKPSAPEEAIQKVLDGGVKTHKDYKALEARLKESEQIREQVQKKFIDAKFETERETKKQVDISQCSINTLNKTVHGLQQQLDQAKRNGDPTKVQELGKVISEKQQKIDNYQQQIGSLNQQLAEKNRQLKEKPIEVTATREVIPDEVKDLIYKKVLLAIEAVKFLADREIDIFTEAVDSDETQDINLTIDSSMSRLRKIKLKMFDSADGAKI